MRIAIIVLLMLKGCWKNDRAWVMNVAEWLRIGGISGRKCEAWRPSQFLPTCLMDSSASTTLSWTSNRRRSDSWGPCPQPRKTPEHSLRDPYRFDRDGSGPPDVKVFVS